MKLLAATFLLIIAISKASSAPFDLEDCCLASLFETGEVGATWTPPNSANSSPLKQLTMNEYFQRIMGTEKAFLYFLMQAPISNLIFELESQPIDFESELYDHAMRAAIVTSNISILKVIKNQIQETDNTRALYRFYADIIDYCLLTKRGTGLNMAMTGEYPTNKFEVICRFIEIDNIEAVHRLFVVAFGKSLEHRQIEAEASDSFLHHARSPEMVDLLSRCGCDFRKKNAAGRTAAEEFHHQGRRDIFMGFPISFRIYFLRKRIFPEYPEHFLLQVNRENSVLETFNFISNLEDRWYEEDKTPVVRFIDTPEATGPGVVKDWLGLVLKSFFVSEEGQETLFTLYDTDNNVYAPNPKVDLAKFRYAGSMVGMAFRYGIPLRVRLIPLILRTIMDEEVSVDDMEYHDSAIHRSFKVMKQNGFDFETAGLFFEDDVTPVTDVNLQAYLEEQAIPIMVGNWRVAAEAFARGFISKTCGADVADYLTMKEFSNWLLGKTTMTSEEFLAGVNYDPRLSEVTKAHFEKCVKEMNPEQIVKLLEYITNVRGIPYTGMSGYDPRIMISISTNGADRMPGAAVCHNILKLSPASTYEAFKQKMLNAIDYCNTALVLH